VNYLLKTYFGMRVYVEIDGKLMRTKKRVAIPEPRHSQLLAWLGRWRVEDFVLPINVYFGRCRLEVSGKH
jgi:hypothetical protein